MAILCPWARDPAVRDVDDEHVVIRVADNGIGIPPEHREKVFETFHRVEDRVPDGTGLGLGICHRIVTRHGGTIKVAESARGTCIEVTLPGGSRPSQPGQSEPDAHLAQR